MSLRQAALSGRWIGLSRQAAHPEMRLFALPYAGAGASIYRRWVTDLGHADWLDFIAVQLPGRETRTNEAAATDIDTVLDEIEDEFTSLSDLPYALMGYSLGALLAYELAIRLTRRCRAPELIVLAARAPSRPSVRPSPRTPPREVVIDKLRRLGGTAPTLMESALFDTHFLPTLQADFAIADHHSRAVRQILPCPVLALAATDDPEVSIERVRDWEAIAGGGFAFEAFSGGHFFLHAAHAQVVSRIDTALTACRPTQRRAS